ncbi:T78.1 [Tupaiid betaherpesvirus 1]|uniref:T78.1 n=1 Tax=Tupaiid herpesvirus 1 (strain 1) TaxID=10397 RepID=Q91TL7_TUHV1|nr:T78.1 [Tupaiid betaherpesvirus 1]AAK57124.1 T78.1 [Tupaiid betaherpesvirus 1]
MGRTESHPADLPDRVEPRPRDPADPRDPAQHGRLRQRRPEPQDPAALLAALVPLPADAAPRPPPPAAVRRAPGQPGVRTPRGGRRVPRPGDRVHPPRDGPADHAAPRPAPRRQLSLLPRHGGPPPLVPPGPFLHGAVGHGGGRAGRAGDLPATLVLPPDRGRQAAGVADGVPRTTDGTRSRAVSIFNRGLPHLHRHVIPQPSPAPVAAPPQSPRAARPTPGLRTHPGGRLSRAAGAPDARLSRPG